MDRKSGRRRVEVKGSCREKKREMDMFESRGNTEDKEETRNNELMEISQLGKSRTFLFSRQTSTTPTGSRQYRHELATHQPSVSECGTGGREQPSQVPHR